MPRRCTNIVLWACIASAGCQQPTPSSPGGQEAGARHEANQSLGGPVVFSRVTGEYWQLWTTEPDGNGERQVTFSAKDKRMPTWSADGRSLLYRTNNSEAYAVDVGGGEEFRILVGFGLIDDLVESPDGKLLAATRTLENPRDFSSIVVTNKNDGSKRLLPNPGARAYQPNWSPDGTQLTFAVSSGWRTQEIFLAGVEDASTPRQLTNNRATECLPAFAPDGQRIAYVSDGAGSYDIWTMRPDGSNKTRLTDFDGMDTRPWWSPDGGQLVFASNRSGGLQIWIMNDDGTRQRQLTSGPPSTDPCWRRFEE